MDLKKIQAEQEGQLLDNKKQVEIEKKAKRKQNRDESDIRKILSIPEGQRMFWRILEQCGVFQDSYVHGDQGYGTTYNVGRKSIGLWLSDQITTAQPNALYTMMTHNSTDALNAKDEE